MRRRLRNRLLKGIQVRVRHLPSGASAMALWPFILIKGRGTVSEALIRHERIHFAQQLEMGIVPFYLWYLLEYAWLRFGHGLSHYDSYRALRFEKEAYTHDADPHYLHARRRWAFRGYGYKRRRKTYG